MMGRAAEPLAALGCLLRARGGVGRGVWLLAVVVSACGRVGGAGGATPLAFQIVQHRPASDSRHTDSLQPWASPWLKAQCRTRAQQHPAGVK